MKYLLRPIADCDPELLRIARILVRPGDVVWDVGANVGLFSCVAAHRAGRDGEVVAIEPDLDVVALLRRSVRALNGTRAPIRVVRTVISERVGIVQFSIAARARAANALQEFGTTQMGGVSENRLLPSLTLDAMLDQLRPPTVVKIDVEGAETKVLAGAQRLLRESRPAIYIEVSSESSAEVTQLLAERDYRLWVGPQFDGTGARPADRATDNTVAIPAELQDRFRGKGSA
jgi:FkbM family methyltransferase